LAIWEGRTNVIKSTENFNNAVWAATGTRIIPNCIAAPDGTMSGSKLVEDTTLSKKATQVIAGTDLITRSFSVYMKAGELYEASIRIGRNKTTELANINLVTGEVTSSGSLVLSISVDPFSGGWWRVSITVEATYVGNQYAVVSTRPGEDEVIGDGISGIYIWGAQVEEAAFLTPYIPSVETFVSRASVGTYIGSDGLIKTAAIDEARMQYNPDKLEIAPKLLLEEERENLCLYSDSIGDDNWSKVNVTATLNDALAPDGTMSASKIVFAGTGQVYQTIESTGQALVSSFFIKGTAGETIKIEARAVDASVVYQVSHTLDGSWQRLDSVRAGSDDWSGQTGTEVRLAIRFDVVNTASTIYAWRGQLEAGAYPSSPIKTEATAVPRVADISTSTAGVRVDTLVSITGDNFSSWYNQEEGSFLLSGLLDSYRGGYPRVISVSDLTSNNVLNVVLSPTDPDSRPYLSIKKDGVAQVSLGSTTVANDITFGEHFNVAFSYKENDVALSVDGGTVLPDIVNTIPKVIHMQLGNRGYPAFVTPLNGYIASLRYYPRAIADSELQIITQGEG